jgi:hypothetical protein
MNKAQPRVTRGYSPILTQSQTVEHLRASKARWIILLTLNTARPIGTCAELVWAVLQNVYPDATALETRRELDYLADHALIKIHEHPAGRCSARLTRLGVDLVDYNVDCDPGIARPAPPYWVTELNVVPSTKTKEKCNERNTS